MKNALLIAVLMTSTASAGDWPQLLGPQRNGVAENETIAAAWPAGGPRVVWSVKVGHGWAGPAVSGGKVVIFHRVGDNDVVEALSADKGQKLWSHSYAADYHDDFGFDPGPRATPTIDGDRVYTHGAQGLLHCFDLATGKVIWSVDTAKQFSSDKGFFGRAGSPLIEGDKLLLNIGAHGAGVAAFDKHTGKLLWKAGDDEAGYSSPTAATINGKRHALFFTRTGLLDVNPDTGHIDADLRWRSEQDASVNAAVPIVVGSRVFLSASYGTGATVVDLATGKPQQLWANDASLSNHYTTSVHHAGHLFGFHGRQEMSPELRCVEFATGNVKWSTRLNGAGSIIIVNDRLLIFTERGELILAPASAEAFKPLARAQVLGFDARAYPALSGGLWYGRDRKQLVCLDLR